MRESSKASLCGITSALSVAVMLMTYVSPFLIYTAPAAAGIILIPVLKEIGRKWAFAAYLTISVLSVFFIADRESAVFFTLLFGYYPIVKDITDSLKLVPVIKLFIRFIIWNAGFASSMLICSFVFNIQYDDFKTGGKIFFALFILLFNLLMLVFDFLLSKLEKVYSIKLAPEFKKLFKK